jgi:hypothetical protein
VPACHCHVGAGAVVGSIVTASKERVSFFSGRILQKSMFEAFSVNQSMGCLEYFKSELFFRWIPRQDRQGAVFLCYVFNS